MKLSPRRTLIAGLLVISAGVILLRPSRDIGSRPADAEPATPVLLVHGMFSTGKELEDLYNEKRRSR